MTVGIALLVHTDFDRAEQVARHWSSGGCPVVIHVDKSVPIEQFTPFQNALSDVENIHFSKRYSCEWGAWGLVQASMSCAQQLLDDFDEVHHVYLASGACLPLRPIKELREYLQEHRDIDFIESVSTTDVPWTKGGLDFERFTLYFPFSWKKSRNLFDKFVSLQRRLKIKRAIPKGLEPHMGSQWWCLSRETLTKILNDPNRSVYDRYFQWVWIPDESYYQTLVRLHSKKIESRSLTLSKFDFQGKPFLFYNDHLQLLQRSDCFVARKIWNKADKLYDVFLNVTSGSPNLKKPNPAKIDLFFSKAVTRRTRGRTGLFMQSRFPYEERKSQSEMHPFWVFQGFEDVFMNFGKWIEDTTNITTHGHLFAKDQVHFANQSKTFKGNLSDSKDIRDYHLNGFMNSFRWNTRGERHCFQFGPDDNQDILGRLLYDQNVRFYVITGAWAIKLFHSNLDMETVKKRAVVYQRNEMEQIYRSQSLHVTARCTFWSLSEFLEESIGPLQRITDEMSDSSGEYLSEVPKLKNLDGLERFLQDLKNIGVQTHLMGDFVLDDDNISHPPYYQKPYLVK